MSAWDRGTIAVRSAIVATLLVVAVLVAATTAEGRAGALDPAFGGAGLVGPELEDEGGARALALGADESIVVLTRRELVRLLADGNLDSGFGDGGRVPLPGELEGLSFRAFDLVVDSEGRVLVAGTVEDPTQATGIVGVVSFSASWAIVLRFSADGQLDPSFGEGKGYVRGDYGMHPINAGLLSKDEIPSAGALKVEVDSLDRPVLLVTTQGLYGPCWGHGGADEYPRAAVRLTNAGAVDPAFGGGDGIAPLDRLAPSPETYFALDAAGNLVVGGGEGTSCPHRGIVFRLAADGSPLPGFGIDGARTYARRYLTALAPTGAMLLRGVEDEAVLRVRPGGEPDPSFGKDGQAALSSPLEAGYVQPVGVDARGRILMAGVIWLPKPPEHRFHKPLRHRRTRRAFFVVSRLLPKGKVDRAFGRRGWIVTPVGPHYELYLEEAALDARGRLVLLGEVTTWHRGSGFVVARYLFDGGN